jgi:hypothetical protein
LSRTDNFDLDGTNGTLSRLRPETRFASEKGVFPESPGLATFDVPMPFLTRRSDPDARQESWLLLYGDFYPGPEPGDCVSGTAASFDEARRLRVGVAGLPRHRTEADLDEYRKHRA